jgi:hypothetical protein
LTSLSVSKARLFNGKSTRCIVMHCCCPFREPKAFSQFSIAIYCSASYLTLHLLWRWPSQKTSFAWRVAIHSIQQVSKDCEPIPRWA